MNIEQLREYCLRKKGVTEGFPFDSNVLVFKVMEKIFCLTSLDSEIMTVNLKCDPEKAIELREEYEDVQPGYHMNKKMWNTVNCEGGLTDKMIYEMIDHSYNEVVKGFSRKLKNELESI